MNNNNLEYDNRQPLPCEHILSDEDAKVKYTIKKFIGAGGTSLAYLGVASTSNDITFPVIIKEVYPKDIAHCLERGDDQSLHINPIATIGNEEKLFYQKKEQALREQKLVSEISTLLNKNTASYVMKPLGCFEGGSTLYTAYDNRNAETLEQILYPTLTIENKSIEENTRKLKLIEKIDLFLSVLCSVAYLHGDKIDGPYSDKLPENSESAKNILHLDLSPSNLMILHTDRSNICLPIDYSCSVPLDGEFITGDKITAYRNIYSDVNVINASKGYTNVTIRKSADVFSLGVILLEMVINRPPTIDDLYSNFSGFTDEILQNNVEQFNESTLKIIKDTFEQLNAVIKKAIHYDECKRYSNVVDFYKDLDEIYMSVRELTMAEMPNEDDSNLVRIIKEEGRIYSPFPSGTVINKMFGDLKEIKAGIIQHHKDHEEHSKEHKQIIEEIKKLNSYDHHKIIIKYFDEFIIKLATLSTEAILDVKENFSRPLPKFIKVKIVMPETENLLKNDFSAFSDFYENFEKTDKDCRKYYITSSGKNLHYLRGFFEGDSLCIIDFPDFYKGLWQNPQFAGKKDADFKRGIIQATDQFEKEIISILQNRSEQEELFQGYDAEERSRIMSFLGNVEFKRIDIYDLEKTKNIIHNMDSCEDEKVSKDNLPTLNQIITDFKDKKRNVYFAEVVNVDTYRMSIQFKIFLKDAPYGYNTQWVFVKAKNICKLFLTSDFLTALFKKGEKFPIVITDINEQSCRAPQMFASLKPIFGGNTEVAKMVDDNEVYLPIVPPANKGRDYSVVFSPNILVLIESNLDKIRDAKIAKTSIKFISQNRKIRLNDISFPIIENPEIQQEQLLKDLFRKYKKNINELSPYIDATAFEKSLEILKRKKEYPLPEDFTTLFPNKFSITVEKLKRYDDIDYDDQCGLIVENIELHSALKRIYQIFGNRYFTENILNSVGIDKITPKHLQDLVDFNILRKIHIKIENSKKDIKVYLIGPNYGEAIMNGRKINPLTAENTVNKVLFLRSMSILKFMYSFWGCNEFPNDLKWGYLLRCDDCSFRASAISESKKVIVDSIVSVEDMDELIDKIERTNKTLSYREEPYELYVICHTEEILNAFIESTETLETDSIIIYATTNKMYEDSENLYQIGLETEEQNTIEEENETSNAYSDENTIISSSADEPSFVTQPASTDSDITADENVDKDISTVEKNNEYDDLSQNEASIPLRINVPSSGPFSTEHIESIAKNMTNSSNALFPYASKPIIAEKAIDSTDEDGDDVNLVEQVSYKKESGISKMDIVEKISKLYEQRTSLGGELRRTKGLFEGDKRKTLKERIEAIDIEIERLKKLL